ncbi:MAG: hypothetical protein IMZ61_11065 [Planctomycetes bacterium]|nr:hypothetical protein [Planctomycetota bacterium]
MTNEQWKAAKEHVDQIDKGYADMGSMPQVNVEFARRMVIAPLQDRYDNGERTPELYAEMMAVE